MLRSKETSITSESKAKPQERVGELRENEKKILENLRKVIKRLADYEAECFGLDKNIVDRNANLAAYLKDFNEEFAGFEEPAEDQDVEVEGQKADVVLLGDHHNLRRNQEFSAKFIEKLMQSRPGPAVLAVEFISPKHQKALEEFLSGQIDEETFLKKVRFLAWGDLEHWGGYKAILETAKKLGIKVYGIKFTAENDEQELGDDFFAKKLADISSKHPQAKIFVHIGNAHLASGHLPEALSQTDGLQDKKKVTVLQNVRPLYFSALEKYKNFQIPKVLKVKDGVYNFITAPLITEVVSDIENLKQLIGEVEEEDIWSDILATEIVARLRKMLDQEVKEQVVDSKDYPPSLFSPSFYSEKNSKILLKQLKENLPAKVYDQYLKTLEEKGCVYIPKVEVKGKMVSSNSLIIKRFRLKKIIEELAKFVIDPKDEKGDISDLQYFCSKLFIPERQPESKADEAGEKVFLDYLAGKQPSLP